MKLIIHEKVSSVLLILFGSHAFLFCFAFELQLKKCSLFWVWVIFLAVLLLTASENSGFLSISPADIIAT